MVQEKDAARKRVARMKQDRIDIVERLKKEIIKTRYIIIEQTPGWTDSGYYGDVYHPAKNKDVSPYFETREEAQIWLDAHEPDKGNRLFIQEQNLRRREWTEWTRY